MKPYKRRLLALSIIFALGAFTLVFVVFSNNTEGTTMDYGLPEGYRCFNVNPLDNVESKGNISSEIIKVIKEDEDVVALYNSRRTDYIYLFDPSGYYFKKGIKGGYFSKEDFLHSDGSRALIYENSAYSLMEDEGSVYAGDREIRVIGTYSKEHPLYERGNGINVVCDFGFESENGGVLYLANCSDQMVTDVKEALITSGFNPCEDWTIYQQNLQDNSSNLLLPGESYLIPAIMLAVFAFTILLYITHTESGNGVGFARGMVKSILPIAAGCLAGCAIGMAVIAALIHKTPWNLYMMAFGGSLGIMLVLAALSWIIFRRRPRRMGGRKGNPLLETLSGKAPVIFLMVAVFFSASNMQEIVYTLMWNLKSLSYARSIEAYDIVSFSGSYKDGAREDLGYPDKICKAALNAIKEGQAYSVVFDGSMANNNINLGVVLGPLMQMNGLEEPKYRYSCYMNNGEVSAAGEAIEIANKQDKNVSPITATVQTFIPIGVSPRVGIEGRMYGSSYVTMSVDDYKSSGRNLALVPMDLCFVNPTREQLKEYMGLLVEEGFHVNVERWNGKAEGETMVYFTSMLVPGIIALCIVLEVLLWAVQAVRIIMLRREEKRIVLELYGAAPRAIKSNIFLLSSAVVMPGVLISAAILPIQSWMYLGIEYVDVKLFFMPVFGGLIGFFAAGIVFTLAVAFLAGRGQFSTNLRIKQLRRRM